MPAPPHPTAGGGGSTAPPPYLHARRLALPSAATVQADQGLRRLSEAGWILEAEYQRPAATVPNIPRSVVLPLAAAITDLAAQLLHATDSADSSRSLDLWIVFLSLWRHALHCIPRDQLGDTEEDSVARRIHGRLHLFLVGDWCTLLQSAHDAEPKERPPTVPSAAFDDRRWWRACQVASLGELRRAMQSLTSTGLAQGAPDALAARLQGLFRRSANPSGVRNVGDRSNSPLVLQARNLKRALRTGGRGSAPGPTGWRYEHLRVGLAADIGFDCFLGFCQLVVPGQVPPRAMDMLAGASLTPLAKPNGGLRPLAVGEVLRRATARAMCAQERESFTTDLEPHQFAVGLPGCCEVIQKSVSVLIGQNPDFLVAALDVHNAYNSILRGTCIQAMRRSQPGLAAFAELFMRGGPVLVFGTLGGLFRGSPLTKGLNRVMASPPSFSHTACGRPSWTHKTNLMS